MIVDGDLKHVILKCAAVNEIDLNVLETLGLINIRLKELGIDLSVSEAKGLVMDRLCRCDLPDQLMGKVNLSQLRSYCERTP